MKKVIRWLDINFEAFMGMIAFFTMLLIILCQIFGRQILVLVFLGAKKSAGTAMCGSAIWAWPMPPVTASILRLTLCVV